MGNSTSSTAVSSTRLASNPAVDSLLDGYHWTSSSITYSFVVPGTSTYDNNYPDKTFWTSTQGFNSVQQIAAQNALTAWSNVANLTFTNVPDNQNSAGTIRLSFSSSHSWVNAAGETYLPNSDPSGGDLFLNPNSPDIQLGYSNGTFGTSSFPLGSYSYFSLIHELGHALGLKHPFDNSTDGGGASIDGTSYSAWDCRVFTVMSYTTLADHSDAIGFTFNPTTPMLLDIEAIQSIYGANYSYNAGNTNYSFNDNAGQYYFQTIWDGGGVNAITYSGTTSSNFDLRQGYGSTVGNRVYAFTQTNPTAYIVKNLWIAYGTNIDNFVGVGTATLTVQCNDDGDSVTCNSGNDTITLGAGTDKVYIGTGVDTIVGGKGVSTAIFNFSSTNYSITTSNGTTTVSSKVGGQGNDILTSVTYLQFSDKTINLLQSTSSSSSTSNTFSGLYSNYLVTPLYSGKNGAFSGFTVKDNVGNTGTSSISSNVQYLTFNSGQTSVTVQNLTSSSITLSSDANVIAIDPTSGASITGGSGTDVIFGGPNDTIYGGKGTATAAFVEPYSNFTITPLYKGKNGAFSGFSVVDNVGSFGTTTINTAVKYLSFGGSGNGATLLTLGSNGTYSVSAGTSSSTTVTQGSVSTFLSSASSAASSSFSISDSNTNVASNIDALQQNSSKIKSITLTSSATNLPISYVQYTNDSLVLTDIVGTYSLNVSAVTLANLSSVSQNPKVIGIALSDTAANIGSNIDTIQAQASKITSIAQTDSSTPINISYAQFASDTKALSLINGSYSLNVSAVPIASFNSVIGSSSVNSVGVTDTDANFVANLSVLNSNVNKISTITLTDSHILTITQAQQTADLALLSKIVGGYTIATNAVTLTPSSTYTALSGQTITGVSGLNTVILNEPYSNFSSSISGTTDVIKDNSGSLGTITLNNIQRVKFSDGSEVALDFQPGQNSFNAAMMIGTAFGTSMVSTYFGAAISLFDQGQTNSQLAGLIEQIGLIENQLNIANDNSASSNKTWVDFVYKNVVGSNPDPLSEAVYMSYLANGTLTRAQILTLAANAADASSGTIASQINLIGLQTKGLVFHSAF